MPQWVTECPGGGSVGGREPLTETRRGVGSRDASQVLEGEMERARDRRQHAVGPPFIKLMLLV